MPINPVTLPSGAVARPTAMGTPPFGSTVAPPNWNTVPSYNSALMNTETGTLGIPWNNFLTFASARAATITGLTSTVGIISGQVTVLQGQVATLQSQVSTLQSQVSTIQGQIVTINSTLVSLQTQINGKLSLTGGTLTGLLTGTDIVLNNNYLTFAGASIGTVNTVGGPLIYADTSNMVFKIGGAGNWFWQDHSGGNVATLNTAGELDVSSVVASQLHTVGGGSAIFFNDRASGRAWAWYGDGDLVHLYNGSGNVVNISPSGDVFPATDNVSLCGTATLAWATVNSHLFTTVSDISRKTDIAKLPECLPLVRAIEPSQYRFKEGPDNRSHWGFIAQDVKAAMADYEFGGHNTDLDSGEQSINYPELTAMLWKAVQEIAARLERLEGKT